MDNTSHASMPQEGNEDNRKRQHEGEAGAGAFHLAGAEVAHMMKLTMDG